jgi:DNA primase
MNRPEDFIQQQEYIKQCAALLKIDEAGLAALVHEYKREQLEKQEIKINENAAASTNTSLPEEPFSFVALVDETEKNILRILLEYGLHIWDEEQTVAEYIFSELDGFHFENEELENLLELYRKQYYEGLQPNAKSLLYYSDEVVRKWVTEITMFPYELSTRWSEKLDGKEVSLQGDYKKDVFLSVKYFKLKKIKKMFEQNQYDMEHTHSADEQVQLMQIHVQLKNIERQITQDIGTVIFK